MSMSVDSQAAAGSRDALVSPEWSRRGTEGAAIGATILASCLCSIDKIVLGAGAAGMLGTRFGGNLYTGLFLAALVLILGGLTLRAPAARLPALAGVLLLAGGLVLSPPSAMHYTQPSLSEIGGFVTMLLGAGAIVWAFLRAFPTRRPRAAGFAAGGFGAAAGCACCVSSGAVAGFAVALGATIPAAPFQDGIFYVAFMAVTLAGLYMLAGKKYALLGLLGGFLAFGGDEALKPFVANDVELLPRLLITLAGTGLIVWTLARAFGEMRAEEPARRPLSGISDGPLVAGSATD